MFVALQAADIIVPALHLSPNITTALVIAALIGFPIALLLSWLFNVQRESSDEPTSDARVSSGLRYITISAVIVFALISTALITRYTRVNSLLGASTLKCADGSEAPCAHNVPVNPDAFAVLPFTDDSAGAQDVNGELAARLVAEGLQNWKDVSIADPLRVSDALRRRAASFRRDIPVDSGLTIARTVGAARAIMGEVWRYADTTRVRAVVYDVASGRALKWREVRMQTGSPEAASAMRRLADALLLADTRLEAGNYGTTTSLHALLAYDRGRHAVDQWDLKAAARELEAAVRADTLFTQARFWLTQVQLWSADTTAAWRSNVAQVAQQHARLAGIDATLGAALTQLAQRNYPAACEKYREVIAADSLNFNAWFGLGDCQAFDAAVVPDPKSASKWAFRSSYQGAIEAYKHALTLVPAFNFAFRSSASSRIDRVMPRYHTSFRSGRQLGSDSVRFAARPNLVSDTLAFVPYPFVEFTQARPWTWPEHQSAALTRNRLVARDLALEWARAFPNDARAREALSLALESVGAIADAARMDESAIVANRAAQALATDDDARIRLQAAEVRLLVKAGDYREARRHAVAMLRRWRAPAPQQARRLAGVAALTGRADEMAELLERAAAAFEPDVPVTGEEVAPPLPLALATSRLLAYASLGGPRDSLQRLNTNAHRALDAYVQPEQKELMHAATLDRAARMLYFTLGPDDVHRNDRPASALINAQRALARRDTSAARAQLDKLSSIRRDWWPGENAVDATLAETQIYLALGDSAAARKHIDNLLGALWTIAPYHFDQPYQPAALVRLMELRAELAARAHDGRTAANWQRAVRLLWANADPFLSR